MDAENKEYTETIHLEQRETGLFLVSGELELSGDFTHLLPRLKKNNLQQELLVKAAKIKGNEHPTAVDATAGLGEDSLLLASAGFSVRMYEQDPIIAALCSDSLERAKQIPELAAAAGRMELFCEDSITALSCLSYTPDVVLLDPMFPERTKSAYVKKKFQLLHQLEHPCNREMELLNAALASGAHKIVIKRPLKGGFLAQKKPSYSLTGKAIRYDVLLQV